MLINAKVSTDFFLLLGQNYWTNLYEIFKFLFISVATTRDDIYPPHLYEAICINKIILLCDIYESVIPRQLAKFSLTSILSRT